MTQRLGGPRLACRAFGAGETVRWLVSAGPLDCSDSLMGRKAVHISEFRVAREESLRGWIMLRASTW